jgi:eukaryotic-like serine/threonine-protein kinase
MTMSKSTQKFLLMFVAAAIGTLLSYLVNQLPGIPDELKQQYPWWDKSVMGTVVMLTVVAFAVAWRSLRLDDDEALKEPAAKKVEQSRVRLLQRLRKTWIEDVLEKSLDHHARLELGMKVSSWKIQTVNDDKPVRLLPGTPIIDRLDALGEGSAMMIVGEPGSGKTMTLLELARDLLERAEQDADAPLPVVLNLAAWDRGYRPKRKFLWFEIGEKKPQSLVDWVIQELETSPLLGSLAGEDYGIPRRVTHWWLREEGRLVLLLDGLDEVAADQREACAKAINAFRQDRDLGNVEIVVCCRANDYKALETKLKIDESLLIQPLTLEQIEDYLVQAKVDLPEIKTLISSEDLQELARQPLILRILAIAYKSIDQQYFTSSTSRTKKLAFLFDAYVYEQLIVHQKGHKHIRVLQAKKYSNLLNICWIKLISKTLEKENRTEFSTANLSFSWLIEIHKKARKSNPNAFNSIINIGESIFRSENFQSFLFCSSLIAGYLILFLFVISLVFLAIADVSGNFFGRQELVEWLRRFTPMRPQEIMVLILAIPWTFIFSFSSYEKSRENIKNILSKPFKFKSFFAILSSYIRNIINKRVMVASSIFFFY